MQKYGVSETASKGYNTTRSWEELSPVNSAVTITDSLRKPNVVTMTVVAHPIERMSFAGIAA